MLKATRKPVVPAAKKPAVAKSAAVAPAAKPKAPAAMPAKKVAGKTAAKPVTKPAAKPAAKKPASKKSATKKTVAVAETKAKKSKTMRDSFNMPEFDYDLIGVLKKRALAAATEVKKSELLRAGLKVLAAMTDKDFVAAVKAVEVVKTGRPGKKK